MPTSDLLLSVPTESIAVRAVLTSLIALLLARAVLRSGVLRLPQSRVVAVLVPTIALVVVVVGSWGRTDLPTLWSGGQAEGGVFIPVAGGLRHLVPVALPLLLTTWLATATARVALRLWRVHQAREAAATAFDHPGGQSARLARTTNRVAARMRIPAPPVAVLQDARGGASVAGVRRPVVVVDRDLLASLDDLELEGLVAHELAHIKRRDNLVAVLVGVARDVAFFVPGIGWALRRLHREREAAADQVAVAHTGRPGALASGLLKVLEGPAPEVGCAAFAPAGSVVARVQSLLDTPPRPTVWRRLHEATVVATAMAAAVAAGVQLPALVASAGEEARDALALVWASPRDASATVAPEAVAFSVYRDNRLEDGASVAAGGQVVPDDTRQLSQSVLRGFTAAPAPSLGLRPRLIAKYDPDAPDGPRWSATPVVPADDGLGVYWLRRLDTAR